MCFDGTDNWAEESGKLLEAIFGWVNLYFGVPLAAVGFTITLIQLHRTKAAANAAKEAVDAASQLFNNNLLLSLLPQLQRIESEIDSAVAYGQRHLISHYMSQWRWQAGQMKGLLDVNDPNAKRVGRAIQTSIAVCASQKFDVANEAISLELAVRPVQEALAKVTGEIGTITTQRAVQEGVRNGNE